jgi:hypothetical protein
MLATLTAYKSTTILFSAGLLALSCVTAFAQQATGVPGSPDATTTINGKQLPPPDAKFGGEIKENALQSKTWWAPRIVPPNGAPNILLIMTDDVGFGAPSTFGGVIPTPSLDRVAQAGLRYTQFHSTALCSPTRAALNNRPQSSRRRLRCNFGSSNRLSWLQQHNPKRCGVCRGDPQGEWLRNFVVREEPQHALVRRQSGRTI